MTDLTSNTQCYNMLVQMNCSKIKNLHRAESLRS